MFGLFSGFFTLFFIAALGYAARKLGVVGDQAERDLNKLVFYFALPSMAFASLVNSDGVPLFTVPVLVQTLAIAAAIALFALGNALLPGARERGSAGVIATTSAYYANLGNIGMPVMIALFGDATIMLPYLLLQQLVFAPASLGILEYLSTRRLNWRALLVMPVKSPLLLSAGLGGLISMSDLPFKAQIAAPFAILGGGAVPMVMFAFGIGLVGRRVFGAATSRMALATVVKSVLMPVIALALAFAFGLSQRDALIGAAVAGLPTAGNVYNFSIKFDTGVPFARQVVLLTTVLSPLVLLAISALVGTA